MAGAPRLRVGLAGFGNVGRAFARLLIDRRPVLRERLGVEPVLVFIADSGGFLGSRDGLDWGLVERALEAPRGRVSGLEGGQPGGTVEEAIEGLGVDVLVDATPSRYDEPETALGWWLRVLDSGGAVVTADKAPLATRCGVLLSPPGRARRLFYKATVMAGTPLVDMLRWGMAGRLVKKVTGVLNGTTNYVLGLAEEGWGFQEAVREAQRRGYAEPDPSADLHGFDLAAKAAILSCTLGSPLSLRDVERRDVVDEAAFQRAREAARRGRRLKYVATVEPGRGARVELVEVGPESPLYRLRGVMNGVLVEPREAEPVYVEGPGAGRLATASSLLADLAAAVLQGVVP